MDSVRLYLEKFKNLRPVDDLLKEAVQVAVKRVVGFDLTKQNIKVQRWTVYCAGPAALRSEIFIHREKILKQIEQELGRSGLKKIL